MKTGRVYKIVHRTSDIVYVGSTFNELRHRWTYHKNVKSTCCISKHIQKYGHKQFQIILISKYLVVDRKHLHMYEQLWMNKLKCINEQMSFDLMLQKCGHGIRKNRCPECDGSEICIHKKLRNQCKDCDGSQICIHKKLRKQCKKCHGSQICIHDRRRSACKNCDGSQICIHERIRSTCKNCDGGSICIHEIRKDHCKKCGGSQICYHNLQIHQCKVCSPMSCDYCQRLYSVGTYSRHCKSKKHLANIPK